MPSDTLIEASVCEDTEGCGEVLLAVQTLLLERLEFGIRADPEFLAGHSLAQSAHCTVLLGRGIVDVECWRHGVM
jgi:hypothetical protein